MGHSIQTQANIIIKKWGGIKYHNYLFSKAHLRFNFDIKSFGKFLEWFGTFNNSL